ncbi:MAG: tetratricopeptide repeat protein, partial [Bdellovibrionales bacterium]|nr:tetratricopeptide repeat protein [Bdellovibrionales bacterium]
EPIWWIYEYTNALNNLAYSYEHYQDYRTALNLKEKLVEVTKPYYQSNSTDWASDYRLHLNNLALSYSIFDEYEKSLELDKISLEIVKQQYRKEPFRFFEDYCSSLGAIAVDYINLKDYQQAAYCAQLAIDVLYPHYMSHPDKWGLLYARSLRKLSGTQKSMEKYEDSLSTIQEAAEVLEQLYHTDQKSFASAYSFVLSRVTEIQRILGQTDAIKTAKKALELIKILYKEDATRWFGDYATSLTEISECYAQQGNIKMAIKYEFDSLSIWKDHSNDDNRWKTKKHIATNLHKLSSYHDKLEEFDKAIKCAIQASEIRKELNKESKKIWAIPYSAVLIKTAVSYNKNEDYINAERYYLEALSVAKTNHTSDQFRWAENYAAIMIDYSFFLLKLNRTDEAIQNGVTSFEIVNDIFALDYEEWLRIGPQLGANLCVLYQTAKMYKESETILKRIEPHLNSYIKKFPKNNEDLIKQIKRIQKNLDEPRED